jgi:hypothetical protein
VRAARERLRLILFYYYFWSWLAGGRVGPPAGAIGFAMCCLRRTLFFAPVLEPASRVCVCVDSAAQRRPTGRLLHKESRAREEEESPSHSLARSLARAACNMGGGLFKSICTLCVCSSASEAAMFAKSSSRPRRVPPIEKAIPVIMLLNN